MTKLIQGFREVLTPINLYPNSIFTNANENVIRKWDVINPFSVNSNNYYPIVLNGAMEVQLSSVRQVLSNVTLTLGNNNITLKGTVVKYDSSGPDIWVSLFYVLEVGKTYTVGCHYKNNKNCFITSPNSDASIRNSYYTRNTLIERNKFPDEEKIASHIFSIGSVNKKIAYQIRMLNKEKLTSFDFEITLYDFYCYEGAFVNPPIFHSLDTKTNALFLREDLSNLNERPYLKEIHPGGTQWYRILSVDNNYYRMILGYYPGTNKSPYEGNMQMNYLEAVMIETSFGHRADGGQTTNCYYLNAKVLSQRKSTNPLPNCIKALAYRLRSGAIYLDVQIADDSVNGWLYLLVLESSCGKRINNIPTIYNYLGTSGNQDSTYNNSQITPTNLHLTFT